jgi:hypothetical protein
LGSAVTAKNTGGNRIPALITEFGIVINLFAAIGTVHTSSLNFPG